MRAQIADDLLVAGGVFVQAVAVAVVRAQGAVGVLEDALAVEVAGTGCLGDALDPDVGRVDLGVRDAVVVGDNGVDRVEDDLGNP